VVEPKGKRTFAMFHVRRRVVVCLPMASGFSREHSAQIGFENAGGSSVSFCLDQIVLSNSAASS
jgi:hypothetical protein